MKKILFISPEFFQYYKYIVEEMEAQGFSVDWYRDLPSNDTFTRAFSRLSPSLIKINTNSYLKKICEETSEKSYDKIVILYGMTFSFSKEQIKHLMSIHPSAKLTLYMWDSIKNLKRAPELFSLCSSIFAFQPSDAIGNIKYLPLFYSKNYERMANLPANQKYFASYIGTAHPQKIKHINEISNKLAEKYRNQFIYHYMPSKLKFAFHKLKDKEYKKIKYSSLKSERLSQDQIIHILSQSVCVLDAPQEGQNGLTMRTIETLGAKRKLITSNQSIKNYDFYNPTNIYIYNENEPIDFSSDFFTKPYEELPAEIYEKYSLKSWVKTLLE